MATNPIDTFHYALFIAEEGNNAFGAPITSTKDVCYILSEKDMMDVLSLKVFVQPTASINAIVHDRGGFVFIMYVFKSSLLTLYDLRLKIDTNLQMVGAELFYTEDEVAMTHTL